MALLCTIFIPSISTMGTCWNSRDPSGEEKKANYSSSVVPHWFWETDLITHHDVSNAEWSEALTRQPGLSNLYKSHYIRDLTEISSLTNKSQKKHSFCSLGVNSFRGQFTDSPLRNFSRSSFFSINSSSNWKVKTENNTASLQRQWENRRGCGSQTPPLPTISHPSHRCVDSYSSSLFQQITLDYTPLQPTSKCTVLYTTKNPLPS